MRSPNRERLGIEQRRLIKAELPRHSALQERQRRPEIAMQVGVNCNKAIEVFWPWIIEQGQLQKGGALVRPADYARCPKVRASRSEATAECCACFQVLLRSGCHGCSLAVWADSIAIREVRSGTERWTAEPGIRWLRQPGASIGHPRPVPAELRPRHQTRCDSAPDGRILECASWSLAGDGTALHASRRCPGGRGRLSAA